VSRSAEKPVTTPSRWRRSAKLLPILGWSKTYTWQTLGSDLLAAVIVTIMLIPQSLAYAMLAGLPPEMGLYASILPLVAYTIFGSSRALAVGPVAVVSLLTAAAAGSIAAQGTAGFIVAAGLLALRSGLFLLILGIFRLGFIANFLSYPVIAGFITASGILIAASQLKHLLGVTASGGTLYEIVWSLSENLSDTNLITLSVGVLATGFLLLIRSHLNILLVGLGMASRPASAMAKAGPVVAVAITILIAWAFDLADHGVTLVGDVPRGLPPLTLPSLDMDLWVQLAGPAILISIIGFVESVSVGQTLASKRRQRIDPDQELIGLGTANIASSLSGGYPVTGGFARSVVNFDAGAETPAAGAFTAVGIAVATLALTPLLFYLPQATLAATIIVAVLTLVDFSILGRTWRYSKADFTAVAGTILITLGFGVEGGVAAGVIISLALHLYRTSRPHIAIVGRVPGTEHFRNVLRHQVETDPHILSVRVDESLYFANARYLEDQLYARVAEQPELRHLILVCPAINAIDSSALESLEEINRRLMDMGVTFHLSEVKGPVMDRLHKTDFFDQLTGSVFLSQHQAVEALEEPAGRISKRPPTSLPATHL